MDSWVLLLVQRRSCLKVSAVDGDGCSGVSVEGPQSPLNSIGRLIGQPKMVPLAPGPSVCLRCSFSVPVRATSAGRGCEVKVPALG